MGNKKIVDFTDLNAWKESHKVVIGIYTLTKKFPKDEMYVLVSQMKRSASSITSNIAEGFGRNSYKERAMFYSQARGSLSELRNQLIISRDVTYITKEEYADQIKQLNIAHQLLQGLITKTREIHLHSS